MPRKFKRKYKKKRPYRRRRMAVVRKSPMPLKFCTKLRYSENFDIDPGAAGICGVQVFNAGGLFDPNVTGTGHQPRGFDQLIAMYDHFVVIGSKIDFKYAQRNASDYSQVVGVSLRDGSSAEADPNDYQELGTVRSALVGTDTNSSGRHHLSLTYSPKKFLGRSKPLSDPNLKGTVSADPAESAYFHCWCAPVQSANASALDCTAFIDYIVVFIEPKDVAQS